MSMKGRTAIKIRKIRNTREATNEILDSGDPKYAPTKSFRVRMKMKSDAKTKRYR